MNRRAFLAGAVVAPLAAPAVAKASGGPLVAQAGYWNGRALHLIGERGAETIIPYARIISAAPRSDGTISIAFGTEVRREPAV